MGDLYDMDVAGIPAETPPLEDEPAFSIKPPWNAAGCAGFCFLAFGAFVLAQLIIGAVMFVHAYPALLRHGLTPAELKWLKTPQGLANILTAPNLIILSLLSDGALILAGPVLLKAAMGARWSSLGIGIQPKARQLALGFAAGLGLLAVSGVIGLIEAKLFGPHPQAIAEVFTLRHGANAFLLDLLSVSLIAPVAEELFFRGVVFTGLVQRMPLLPAAMLSAIVFGAAHLDGWNFPSLFVIGIGLAYLYYYSKTLWTNIAAHATINGITLVLAYVAPQFVK